MGFGSRQVSFNPSSTLLFCTDFDGLLRIWNLPLDTVSTHDPQTFCLDSGECSSVRSVLAHPTCESVFAMGLLSLDGRRIVVSLWDMCTSFDRPVQEYSLDVPGDASKSQVTLALSSCGQFMACLTGSSSLALFDLVVGQHQFTIEIPSTTTFETSEEHNDASIEFMDVLGAICIRTQSVIYLFNIETRSISSFEVGGSSYKWAGTPWIVNGQQIGILSTPTRSDKQDVFVRRHVIDVKTGEQMVVEYMNWHKGEFVNLDCGYDANGSVRVSLLDRPKESEDVELVMLDLYDPPVFELSNEISREEPVRLLEHRFESVTIEEKRVVEEAVKIKKSDAFEIPIKKSPVSVSAPSATNRSQPISNVATGSKKKVVRRTGQALLNLNLSDFSNSANGTTKIQTRSDQDSAVEEMMRDSQTICHILQDRLNLMQAMDRVRPSQSCFKYLVGQKSRTSVTVLVDYMKRLAGRQVRFNQADVENVLMCVQSVFDENLDEYLIVATQTLYLVLTQNAEIWHDILKKSKQSIGTDVEFESRLDWTKRCLEILGEMKLVVKSLKGCGGRLGMLIRDVETAYKSVPSC